ncbi:peptidase U32 [Ruminiclostridium papyrosolvens DSM 2782]|uniref:Peptidase U32 n=1 Tax=Ruminiclostridium papyrosolvens DSM 2782 TaxID=588581 RepID=F1TDH9_9FIRM|nr:U32 family peptidase [Ruminiclostridium papyrosolvens]EGD47617.1 peptidase U32 [Ruminiclostridium papyrosolvens DSM 2782]WES36438.1 U32 family peptidase [Ruminiclostridium papyrosolvens DSM 2782]
MDENQKTKSIKFDMAYNFDKKLIEDISKFGIVSGVYAKMKHDDVGGGRASLILPEVSWQKIEEHVQLCHKNNIKFNYLLNALCLGNKEFVKEHHKKILELLDRVVNAKVDSVTVANPYICQMIKKQYPHLEVSISVNLRIRSLQQIRYWEGFGADEITLDQLVNRDFNLLREILKYTKQTGTRIRLFANNLCLHDCPLRTHHGLSNSHASQTGEYTTESHILYEYYLCTLLKMTSPAKLISATWIRPDDVHYYEELMNEVGNPNLSLKLVERGSTSEYLLKTVKAYSERRFDGNLMDIIYAIQKRFLLDNKKEAADDSNVFAERISKGEYNPESLRKLDNLFNLDWFHIDNRKLDGFLDKFKSKSCGNKICDDEGWRQSSSLDINSEQTCSYCRAWAEKAITVDEDKRRQYIEGIREFLDDLNSSKVFNLNKA